MIIPVEPDLLNLLEAHSIALSFDIDEVRSRRSWLYGIQKLTIGDGIEIEACCGFYGGPYSPNPWTASGGLCSMGFLSYSHSPLPSGLKIGRYCSIGRGLKFLDFAHPVEWLSTSVAFFRPEGVAKLSSLQYLRDEFLAKKNVPPIRSYDPTRGKSYPIIENDVWIAENVSLGMGIKIGTGSVVAAESVVTKDVPPYAVVSGVPAKVRKFRFPQTIIDKLNNSQWWEYNYADLVKLNYSDIASFIDSFELEIADGSLKKWTPQRVRLPEDLSQK